MRRCLSGLCALMLWPALSPASARAEDSASEAATCDVACQLQIYVNTDHMVTLVPAQPWPVEPPLTRKVVKASRAAVPSRPTRREASHGRIAAPKRTPSRDTAARDVPGRPLPSPLPMARTEPAPPPAAPAIPGSVPTMMTRFVVPGAPVEMH